MNFETVYIFGALSLHLTY